MLNLKSLFPPSLDIKITDEANSDLHKYIEPLLIELNTYKIRRKLRNKNIEFIIPVNFEGAVYNNSCDYIKQLIDSYGYGSDINGHFCTPLDINLADFKIIINQNIFKNIQYYGTIYHEFPGFRTNPFVCFHAQLYFKTSKVNLNNRNKKITL